MGVQGAAAATRHGEDPSAFWRVVRGTVAGTIDLGKAFAIEARFTYGKTKTSAEMAVKRYRAARSFSDDDQPDADEIPFRRRSPVSYACFGCARKWGSAYALNKHMDQVHKNEAPAWSEAERAKARRPIKAAAPAKKSRVRGTAAPRKEKAVKAATEHARGSGARGMASTALAKIKAAFEEFGESRPRALSEIEEDMRGMELLHAHMQQAVDAYRRRLIMMGFDPGHLQGLARVSDRYGDAGRGFSTCIATIQEQMAKDIAAAKERQKATNATKPADHVLAN